ncbi:MAG: GspE/PulE family protein [Planctomycetota bacterium]
MPDTDDPRTSVEPPNKAEHLFPDPLRTLLWNAALEGATDVHLHSTEDGLRVLHRIDGILHLKQRLSEDEGRQLINQIRSAAELTTARTFVPEEGQIVLHDGHDKWEFRVTIVPMGKNVSAHMRILDVPEATSNLSQLGFGRDDQDAIHDTIQSLSGLLLISGSTGTGKTTTLYSIASVMDAASSAVYSIEDPVEFRLRHAQQIEVDERHDLTMYAGLRTILRMDPDMILVGEIRDRDSAIVAARAALSGRLVLATIHAQDAMGAIQALHYLGVPNYVIAGSLRLSIAQSLVRRLCRQCATSRSPYEEEMLPFRDYGMAVPETVFQAVGCDKCHGHGYRGRMGVFETVVMEPDLAKLIGMGAQRRELLAYLRDKQITTLVEDGLTKVAQGMMTTEELYRACGSLRKDLREKQEKDAYKVDSHPPVPAQSQGV